MSGSTYLDRIIAAHRSWAEHDRRDRNALRSQALSMLPCRAFGDALAHGEYVAVIAEVKRRSPSKGALNVDLDPAELAGRYEAGGAACLSVLTDEGFFGGSAADLAAARGATNLPTIRKDFTVCENDVYDARIMGADCVLLIAAALTEDELGHFHETAREIGLDVLVEIHDEAELQRVLAVKPTIIGVNQRDLVTFEVDTDRAVRVVPAIPAGIVRVAESGITGPAAAETLATAGFDALLVGETLVRSGDPAGTVASLRVRRTRT